MGLNQTYCNKRGAKVQLYWISQHHNHLLVEDFLNGISKEEAEKRIHEIMKDYRAKN